MNKLDIIGGQIDSSIDEFGYLDPLHISIESEGMYKYPILYILIEYEGVQYGAFVSTSILKLMREFGYWVTLSYKECIHIDILIESEYNIYMNSRDKSASGVRIYGVEDNVDVGAIMRFNRSIERLRVLEVRY